MLLSCTRIDARIGDLVGSKHCLAERDQVWSSYHDQPIPVVATVRHVGHIAITVFAGITDGLLHCRIQAQGLLPLDFGVQSLDPYDIGRVRAAAELVSAAALRESEFA